MFYLEYALKGLRKIYNQPERKGRRGERRLIRYLGDSYGHIFDDYIILDEKGNSHQIDTILVNKRGVFVIEVKNYVGQIYGNDEMLNWYSYFNGAKQEFYSPVKQNETHCKYIKEVVPLSVPVHSLVVFNKNNASHVESNVTINLIDLKNVLDSYKEVLDDETVNKVIALLTDARETDISDEEHAKSVKERLR